MDLQIYWLRGPCLSHQIELRIFTVYCDLNYILKNGRYLSVSVFLFFNGRYSVFLWKKWSVFGIHKPPYAPHLTSSTTIKVKALKGEGLKKEKKNKKEKEK